MLTECTCGHTSSRFQVLALASIVVVAMLVGCPNPDVNIRFEQGNKTREVLHLKLVDGELKLELHGFTGPLPLPATYQLQLTVVAKYPRLEGELEFFPENVEVLFGQCILQKNNRMGYIDSTSHATTNKLYKASLNFITNLKADGTTTDAVPNDDKLRVILNDFVYYKGAAVPIDTIVAVEPKTKLGLTCQR